jgi:hypothetical protein
VLEHAVNRSQRACAMSVQAESISAVVVLVDEEEEEHPAPATTVNRNKEQANRSIVRWTDFRNRARAPRDEISALRSPTHPRRTGANAPSEFIWDTA